MKYLAYLIFGKFGHTFLRIIFSSFDDVSLYVDKNFY